jgi:hypothetical protein
MLAGDKKEKDMPELKGDIDYTVDADAGETTLRANTPKGEEFLDGPELTMPNEEAKAFIEEAREVGLEVKSFS